MPRRAHLSVPGIPWHIVQRGNNRSACFYADEDYRRYLDELADLSVSFGCAVHAYALMTNHVHLLLTPGKADGAALLTKHLGQRYVQYISTAPIGAAARCGEAGFAPALRKAKTMCWPVTDTLNSTPYAQRW